MGLYWGGGLYSEGLQRKKVVGLYLGGLIFGGAYFRRFTVLSFRAFV